MGVIESILNLERAQGAIRRGVVLAAEEGGDVHVEVTGSPAASIVCDRLSVSEGSGVVLGPGDSVLLWMPEEGAGRGVVLGRIGGRARSAETPSVPEELVIEARKGLTLRCGEGSITLREDGKILIKGKDLVSRAEKLNRIKGGAVSIN